MKAPLTFSSRTVLPMPGMSDPHTCKKRINMLCNMILKSLTLAAHRAGERSTTREDVNVENIFEEKRNGTHKNCTRDFLRAHLRAGTGWFCLRPDQHVHLSRPFHRRRHDGERHLRHAVQTIRYGECRRGKSNRIDDYQ